MNDWEENPDAYMRDDNGDFILKKDGTPRKKLADPKVRQVEATTTTPKPRHRLMQGKLYERKKNG